MLVHCVNACVCFEANKYSSGKLVTFDVIPILGLLIFRGSNTVNVEWKN